MNLIIIKDDELWIHSGTRQLVGSGPMPLPRLISDVRKSQVTEPCISKELKIQYSPNQTVMFNPADTSSD